MAHTVKFRQKAVALAARLGVAAAAKRLGVDRESLYRWRTKAWQAAHPPVELPKLRPLIVTKQYACPHCGAPVEVSNGSGQ